MKDADVEEKWMLHCDLVQRYISNQFFLEYVIQGVTERIKTTFGTRASLTRPWTHILSISVIEEINNIFSTVCCGYITSVHFT